MNSTILRLAVLLVVATFGIKVFAHARLKTTGTLVPRTTNPGIKVAPCGGFQKLNNPAVFAPGATIQVDWEETINHPGRYEFYFSEANDQNFGQPLKTVQDTQDTPVVNNNFHQYSTTVTLPNVTCNGCTLQMIQVMTDTNPASYYYSCADIRLQNGPPPPNPVPTPTPTPSPSPAPNCH
jgi:hypothetical protein